jgi:mono/diheme cytochrome c family protein
MTAFYPVLHFVLQGKSSELEVPVSRLALVLPAFLIVATALPAQQTSAQSPAKVTPYSAIPVEEVKRPNPIKADADSIARAQKWWTIDCAMCHGKTGDGKGDTAKDMKLAIVDLTDPATLKERTDGEIFYIIKNGHQDMPPEGGRVKTEENWDLVNYVRSLSKKGEEAK